jgi:hypothetical protein
MYNLNLKKAKNHQNFGMLLEEKLNTVQLKKLELLQALNQDSSTALTLKVTSMLRRSTTTVKMTY